MKSQPETLSGRVGRLLAEGWVLAALPGRSRHWGNTLGSGCGFTNATLMGNMGLAFVLFIWAIIGAVLAVGGGAVLFGMTALLTRRAGGSRRWLLRAVALFPAAAIAWAAVVFVFQAIVNGVLLQRDVSLGDGFQCPLPNGYILSFIDEVEIGTLYKPANRFLAYEVTPGAIHGVRKMQLAGDLILGLVEDGSGAQSFFLLDAKSGERSEFSTYAELVSAAKRRGTAVELVPSAKIFAEYRLTWFDAFVALLVIFPVLAVAGGLLWWTIRVRRRREMLSLRADQ